MVHVDIYDIYTYIYIMRLYHLYVYIGIYPSLYPHYMSIISQWYPHQLTWVHHSPIDVLVRSQENPFFWSKPLGTIWGPPVMWMLVYKPHEYYSYLLVIYSYIYHKPWNSATFLRQLNAISPSSIPSGFIKRGWLDDPLINGRFSSWFSTSPVAGHWGSSSVRKKNSKHQSVKNI